MPLLTLALILDTVILVVGAALFLRANPNILRRIQPQKNRFSNIEEAQTKSYELLHAAIKKAEGIVEETNRQQTNVISEAISQTGKFEEGLKDQLQAHTQVSRHLYDSELKNFLDNLTAAHQEYINFLEGLKKQAQQVQFDNLNTVKQTTSQLFLQFESELSGFLVQTREQSTSAIELEIKAMRQMVESYRQQQLKVVDENIIAMLERTLSLVLPKKLTLNDQVDLIYESLEKAKAEKFIV